MEYKAVLLKSMHISFRKNDWKIHKDVDSVS